MPNQPPWRAVIAVLVLAVWPVAPSVVQAWASWPASPADVHDALDHLYPLTAYAAGLTLLLALSGRSRHALWLLVPAAVLALPELFYVAAYGLPSGAHVFGILAETDTSETLAFVGPWWPWALVAWLALVAVAAWSARQWWRADWRWRHRSRYWVLAAGAALLTGCASVYHSIRCALALCDDDLHVRSVPLWGQVLTVMADEPTSLADEYLWVAGALGYARFCNETGRVAEAEPWSRRAEARANQAMFMVTSMLITTPSATSRTANNRPGESMPRLMP